jgi:Family of unknown function (DUF5989)
MESSNLPSDEEVLLKQAANPGFLGSVLDFIWTSRKWWMVPVILLLLLLGVALGLVNTAMAPFIYTLF